MGSCFNLITEMMIIFHTRIVVMGEAQFRNQETTKVFQAENIGASWQKIFFTTKKDLTII